MRDIECETGRSGRWYIPAPIVYGVIIAVVTTALGGGMSGLLMAVKINQALDKIHAMPSASQMAQWRQRQHTIDQTQDRRLDRLENKVFNLKSLGVYRYSKPFYTLLRSGLISARYN